MLKKKHRIGSSRIKYVLSKGKKYNFDNFSVRVITGHENNRFSVTIGKDKAKKAVTRNRLRRQIYEIIRLANPESNPPLDISIFLKLSAVTLDKQHLKTDITNIIHSFIKPK